LPAASIALAASRAEEDPGQIDVDDPLPVGQWQLLWRTNRGGAGVVDEDIESAQPVDRFLDHRRNRPLIGHVRRDGQAFSPSFAEARRRSLHGLESPANADHRGTGLGQRFREDNAQS
jgi:hypothetical protein